MNTPRLKQQVMSNKTFKCHLELIGMFVGWLDLTPFYESKWTHKTSHLFVVNVIIIITDTHSLVEVVYGY